MICRGTACRACNAMMKIVFLDASTVDLGDVDTSSLKKCGEYIAHENCTAKDLRLKARGAQVIITNKCLMRHEEFAALPDLKLICAAATGYNHIDTSMARARGIGVCNVPSYSTISVAEHTLMLMLAAAHRLREHERSVREGDWCQSPHFADLRFPFEELSGRTLGIFGYGAIGKHVARLARAFGMKVMIARLPGRKYPARPARVSLAQICRQADYISTHCALSDDTCELVNDSLLNKMRPHTVVLNLARGAVVNETNMAQALRRNQIALYATDVLQKEPPLVDHPLLAADLREKILITPHIAWASRSSRQRLIDGIAANINGFRQGRRLHRVE